MAGNLAISEWFSRRRERREERRRKMKEHRDAIRGCLTAIEGFCFILEENETENAGQYLADSEQEEWKQIIKQLSVAIAQLEICTPRSFDEEAYPLIATAQEVRNAARALRDKPADQGLVESIRRARANFINEGRPFVAPPAG